MQMMIVLVHSPFWEICGRGQVTQADVRICVLCKRSRHVNIRHECLGQVSLRTTLAVVLLFRAWIIWAGFSSLKLRRNVVVIVWTRGSIKKPFIASCSLPSRWFYEMTWLSIGWRLLALRSLPSYRISRRVSWMVDSLAQHRHILPSRFFNNLRIVNIIGHTGWCSIIVLSSLILLRCFN